MNCPVCNAELPSTARFCGGCGTTLTTPPSPQPPPPAAAYEQPRPAMNAPSGYGVSALPMVQKKYKALRFIAVLIKILAFVAGAIFIIAALVMLVAGIAGSSSSSARTPGLADAGPMALFGGVLGALFLLVYGVFIFIFLYAYSEWMYVFMDIEENTRVTNEMLVGRR